MPQAELRNDRSSRTRPARPRADNRGSGDGSAILDDGHEMLVPDHPPRSGDLDAGTETLTREDAATDVAPQRKARPNRKKKKKKSKRRKAFEYRMRLFLYRVRVAIENMLWWLVAPAVWLVFRSLRALGPDRASNLGGWFTRTLGPLLPVHRVGQDNLRHAYPDKSEAEREAILREAWDNLGRTAADYAHLKDLWDFDPEAGDAGRIDVSGIDNFVKLREDGKPAIIFTAHLGNWELPAICASRHGLPVTAVYRAPSNPYVARQIEKIRSRNMGNLLQAGSGQAVIFKMASVLERGGHLGILVDQHLRRGLKIPFFGRTASTNPSLGRLARRFECPVHGVRVIRLPGNRFRLELTDALELPRDHEGAVDVEGTMRMVNGIVEGWVREHPGQWLWLHRRWR